MTDIVQAVQVVHDPFPHSAGHSMVTKRINSMGTKNGHTVG